MIRARRLAWLPLGTGAGPAFAHSPVPGIEGFYVGLLHPFSTPAQALVMFGLALLVGGFGVDKARWALLAFLIASLAGLMIALQVAALDALMFAVAFAAATLAALVPGHLLVLAIAITGAAGLLIGDASIPDAGPARDRIITMTGSLVGANLGLLYLFGAFLFLRERFTWPWVTIAFRVAAAWLGAIALVMLALGYAEGAGPDGGS